MPERDAFQPAVDYRAIPPSPRAEPTPGSREQRERTSHRSTAPARDDCGPTKPAENTGPIVIGLGTKFARPRVPDPLPVVASAR